MKHLDVCRSARAGDMETWFALVWWVMSQSSFVEARLNSSLGLQILFERASHNFEISRKKA